MSTPSIVWTNKKITELKAMWKKGFTTAQIGKKLAVSKNAVVGKAHRLGLKSRPSPIKAMPPKKKAPAIKKPAPKKPLPKPKSAPVKKAPPPKPTAKKTTRSAPKPAPKPAPREMPAPLPAAHSAAKKAKEPESSVDINDLRQGMCKWPLGDPRAPNFRFCGRPALEGHSYCAAHHTVAYTGKTSREDKKQL